MTPALLATPVRAYADSRAHSAFLRAHLAATVQGFLRRLLGRSTDLERLADARRRAGPLLAQPLRRREVPLAAVVGSVDRSRDYLPGFLPRLRDDETRWAGVLRMMDGDCGGLPPIRAFQLGDRYFVEDGHHRVSVARWLGYRTIEAFVTELRPFAAAA